MKKNGAKLIRFSWYWVRPTIGNIVEKKTLDRVKESGKKKAPDNRCSATFRLW